jgi:hypothetical protein
MPFIISLAICLHIAVLGPLFLLSKQGDQIGLDPMAFLLWPLGAGLAVALVSGLILSFSNNRGFIRPVAVAAAVGLALYVQFYVFVGDFGPFDGRVIDFGAYKLQAITEIAVLLALVAIALARPQIAVPLFGRLLGMLLAFSVAATCWSVMVMPRSAEARAAGADLTGALAASNFLRDRRPIPGVTSLSRDKNVIVLLLDTLQVDVFEKVIRDDPKLQEQFAGFQLFTNATGHFPYTALSIPSILTGEIYGGSGETIPQYLNRAAQNRLEVKLAQQGFAPSRIALHTRTGFLTSQGSTCRRFGEAYDLYSFRQVPVAAKAWFYDEGRFRIARQCSGVPTTEPERDLAVLDRLVEDSAVTSSKPTVKYIHLWGAHPPAMLNPDCTVRRLGAAFTDFQGQAHCLLKETGRYLDKLRSLGVFDNTMMFILSDHGSRYGFLKKRAPGAAAPPYVMSSANPTIAFHAFGDNSPFRTTSAPATLSDVVPTIMSQLSLPGNGNGVDITALNENTDRLRTFTFFRNAGDAANEFLSNVDHFEIRGSVQDPKAWTVSTDSGLIRSQEAPLSDLSFGSAALSRYLGLGWSAEAKGVAQSWIISNPAVINGTLPDADKVRLYVNFLNPHKDQRVSVKLNGREVAQWSVPFAQAWTDYAADFLLGSNERGRPARIELVVAQIGPVGSDAARDVGISVKAFRIEPAE